MTSAKKQACNTYRYFCLP